MNNMIYVIVIFLMLFMIPLKIILREGSLVVETSILLKLLSLCRKFSSCTLFTFLCMSHCASLIYFLPRCLCIGSGLGLDVFHVCLFLLFIYSSTSMN